VSHRDDRAFPQVASPFDAERPVTRPPIEIIAPARAPRLLHQSFRVDQMTEIDLALADKATNAARNGIRLVL
jgi:hypothetical protein